MVPWESSMVYYVATFFCPPPAPPFSNYVVLGSFPAAPNGCFKTIILIKFCFPSQLKELLKAISTPLSLLTKHLLQTRIKKNCHIGDKKAIPILISLMIKIWKYIFHTDQKKATSTPLSSWPSIAYPRNQNNKATSCRRWVPYTICLQFGGIWGTNTENFVKILLHLAEIQDF